MQRAESMVFWCPLGQYVRLPLDTEQMVLIACEFGNRSTTVPVRGETWIFDFTMMQAHLQPIGRVQPTMSAAFLVCTGRMDVHLLIPTAW